MKSYGNKRNILRLFCFLAVVLFTAWSENTAAATHVTNVTIRVGESRPVHLDFDLKAVEISDESTCQYRVASSREIVLLGKKTGKTNVLVRDGSNVIQREIWVHVIGDDAMFLKDLKNVIKEMEGVTLRKVGGLVVVEGAALSMDDYKKLQILLEGVPNVKNLVKVSPVLRNVQKKQIEEAIKRSNITVNIVDDIFILEGMVLNQHEAEQVEKIARRFVEKVENNVRIVKPGHREPPQMVELQVTVMTIDKSAMKDLGVHWNPSGNLTGNFNYGVGSQAVSLGGLFDGVVSNLLPKLSKLKSEGMGRVLIEQRLITKSGEKAQFAKVEEIPIQVAQGNGVFATEFKQVGLTIKFHPMIQGTEGINTNIEVESSFVIREEEKGPRISSTKLQNAIYIKSGEAIALGGLINQRELLELNKKSPETQADTVALVQQNKAERAKMERSEMLVFVMAKILQRASDSMREMNHAVQDSFKEYEREAIRELKEIK